MKVEGDWVLDSEGKADALAKTLASKYALLQQSGDIDYNVISNEYSMHQFIPIRRRKVAKFLKDLDEDTASGSDTIPSRILKKFSWHVSLPLTIVCRQLYRRSMWLDIWKTQWITGIYKRACISDPNNYRGVHLTTLFSKIAERVICEPMMDFLCSSGIWGDSQFAYR